MIHELDAAAIDATLPPQALNARASSVGFGVPTTLTGATAADLAAAYSRETGKPWCQQLGVVHSLWEAGFAALAACADPHDSALLAETLASLEVDTLVGPLSWRETRNGTAAMPLLGGQWRTDRASGRPQLRVTTPDPARGLQPEARFELM